MGNDPVNGKDPTGLTEGCPDSSVNTGASSFRCFSSIDPGQEQNPLKDGTAIKLASNDPNDFGDLPNVTIDEFEANEHTEIFKGVILSNDRFSHIRDDHSIATAGPNDGVFDSGILANQDRFAEEIVKAVLENADLVVINRNQRIPGFEIEANLPYSIGADKTFGNRTNRVRMIVSTVDKKGFPLPPRIVRVITAFPITPK